MFDKLKQLGQLKAIQDELKKMQFTSSRDGVTVTVNGSLMVDLIEIESISDQPAALAELIKNQTNEAIKKAQREMAQKMSAHMGGLGM